jgi:hypothetical protein
MLLEWELIRTVKKQIHIQLPETSKTITKKQVEQVETMKKHLILFYRPMQAENQF